MQVSMGRSGSRGASGTVGSEEKRKEGRLRLGNPKGGLRLYKFEECQMMLWRGRSILESLGTGTALQCPGGWPTRS